VPLPNGTLQLPFRVHTLSAIMFYVQCAWHSYFHNERPKYKLGESSREKNILLHLAEKRRIFLFSNLGSNPCIICFLGLICIYHWKTSFIVKSVKVITLLTCFFGKKLPHHNHTNPRLMSFRNRPLSYPFSEKMGATTRIRHCPTSSKGLTYW
jgi:hypothetical protein